MILNLAIGFRTRITELKQFFAFLLFPPFLAISFIPHPSCELPITSETNHTDHFKIRNIYYLNKSYVFRIKEHNIMDFIYSTYHILHSNLSP